MWYNRVPQKLTASNFFPKYGVHYILQHTDTYLSQPRSSTFISTVVLRTSDTTATANYSVVSLLKFSQQCNQGSLSFGMWHYFAENAMFHLKSVSLPLMQLFLQMMTPYGRFCIFYLLWHTPLQHEWYTKCSLCNNCEFNHVSRLCGILCSGSLISVCFPWLTVMIMHSMDDADPHVDDTDLYATRCTTYNQDIRH